MSLLFGVGHEYFAEMIMKYLSNGADSKRISLVIFLDKFKLFWPKKIDED